MKFIQALSKRWKWCYLAAWLWFGLSVSSILLLPSSPPETLNIFTFPYALLFLGAVLIRVSGLLFLVSAIVLAVRRGIFAGFVLAVSTLGIIIGLLAVFGASLGERFEHFKLLESMTVGGQKYHLVFYIPTDILSNSPSHFVLYECDQIGFACSELYRQPDSGRMVFQPISPNQPSRIRISDDQVNLYLGNQFVYSHQFSP